jgi:hypothetical protein
MASVTSTFRVARRARSAGFKRGKISCNGKLINLLSSSPPEFTKIPGAKCRNSPKEIFTAPKANWLITISAGNRIVPLAGGAARSFAFNSSGRPATTDASGSSSSLALAAHGAGERAEAGLTDGGDAGTGTAIGEAGALDRASARFPTRPSSARRKPANLVLTEVAMTQFWFR